MAVKQPICLADETLEDLQIGGYRILQKKHGFRFGMDAVLLADFTRLAPDAVYADFGTGTGILPLLLTARGKGSRCEAFELQPDWADMAARTMEMNDLADRIHIHCEDVRNAPALIANERMDAVVCNPPYGMPGKTMLPPEKSLEMARHQDADGLLPWFKSAHRILRGKGRISVIFPAPRIYELMRLMDEARLTPKRLRLVYPSSVKPANLALIEAVKDAKPLVEHEPPLIIYDEEGQLTQEMRRIYHMEERM